MGKVGYPESATGGYTLETEETRACLICIPKYLGSQSLFDELGAPSVDQNVQSQAQQKSLI